MVTDSSPLKEGKGADPLPSYRYGKDFEKLCPYYMSLGMTYSEYWDGDAWLPKYFREAEEYRKERINAQAHLQACYIYEALIDVYPMFNPLVKRNKPFPFRSEPMPITRREADRQNTEHQKKLMQNGIDHMRAFMKSVNTKLRKGVSKWQ